MLVSGSWSVTTITSNENTADDFSFFPFPAVTGGKEEEAGYLYGGVANTLAVSNNTEHKEAAQKFLKFYLSEDEQTRNVERTGTFSPVQVSPDSNNMTALAYDFSQYVSEEVDGFFPYTDQALASEESEKLLNALSAIVSDANSNVTEELGKVK